MDDIFDVNKRIEEIMEANSLTQYKLSKLSGVAQSTIASWYRRKSKPTLPMLLKVCVAFGMTLDEFFGITANPGELSREIILLQRIFNRLSENEKLFVIEAMEYIEGWLCENR